jgi:hypothetical protein
LLLIILAGGTYVAYSLNLLGPMMQMGNAAWGQGLDIGKQKLREFLENNETARQAIAMPARRDTDSISLETLDSRGKRASSQAVDDDDDI